MNLETYRRHYRQLHQSVGCRLTHMFGIPLIVASLVIVFFSWKLALILMVPGWLLLWAGHYLFEQNRPALFSDWKNPLIYLSAVIFVGEEWWRLLTTGSLKEEPPSH